MAHDETGVVAVELLEDQGPEHVVEGGQGLGFRHQQKFKLAVVHHHILPAQFDEPPDGGGVGHCAKKEPALKDLAVSIHLGAVVAQGGEILYSLDDIGQVAQVIFDVLGAA